MHDDEAAQSGTVAQRDQRGAPSRDDQRVTIREGGRQAVAPRWALDAYVAEVNRVADFTADDIAAQSTAIVSDAERLNRLRAANAGVPAWHYDGGAKPTGPKTDLADQRVTIRDGDRTAVVPRWALDAYVAEIKRVAELRPEALGIGI